MAVMRRIKDSFDPAAAMDYAQRLKALALEVAPSLFIVMRVYFEKPRTSTGWKGYINDPRMDDSFHIEQGIGAARRLLVDLAELGLPTGSEALDPLSPQYLADLITWYAIGALQHRRARTHRREYHRLAALRSVEQHLDCFIGVERLVNLDPRIGRVQRHPEQAVVRHHHVRAPGPRLLEHREAVGLMTTLPSM